MTLHPSANCRQLASLLLAASVAILAGCSPDIDTTYGNRAGYGTKSINGTAVLGHLFQQAGHKVRSWHVLSPSLHEADVIVWAPDDFDLPPQEAQEWLDSWLRENYGEKVLIYIGRDYENTVSYWSHVQDVAPPEQLPQVKRRLTEAIADQRTSRQVSKAAEWPDWFTIDGTTNREQVRALDGPWAEGIDATKVEIEHHSRIVPDEKADVLLATGDGAPLVSEMIFRWDEDDVAWDAEDMAWNGSEDGRAGIDLTPSRLIVIENGSFLLNRPLINHEHRKLANRLVAHVGPPRKTVIFLQSSRGGPPVRDTDPTGQPPSGLAMFGVWPISGVLVHVAALGIVFALARWPIFGVPRRLEQPSLTDFGAHVEALGRLLQRIGDVPHALNLLRIYRHTVLGESEPESSEAKS